MAAFIVRLANLLPPEPIDLMIAAGLGDVGALFALIPNSRDHTGRTR
jgi:hypothetical protein